MGTAEWVVWKQRDLAEDDQEELHAEYLAMRRESREAHERRYYQQHIDDLSMRLESTNKSLKEFLL